MTPGPLHALFERLFGEADNAARGSVHAHQAAHLAASLDRGESDALEVPELAAYLDGGLDEASQQNIHARLSQSPSALHEAASADAFLGAVKASQLRAPVDLVASILTNGQPTGISASSPPRSFPIWKWSGVALGMVVAVLAVMVIVSRTAPPTDITQPVTAKSAPTPVAPADTPKLAQPQPRQGENKPPVVAGEKVAPTYLAPTALEETMPPSSRTKSMPFAPEGADIMPGQKPSNR
ncbi:MAG: hypothetical protein Q7R40_01285 [Phaeospirillum sp.]|nr:hypothetical protein [Phaeospirillum sp.]